LEFPATWCYHNPDNRRDRAAERLEKHPLAASARASSMIAVGAGMLGGSS